MPIDPANPRAEDIGRAVLQLIESLRDARDLSPEHIERITGMTVRFNSEDRHVYGFGGPLGGDWSYNLVSTPDKLYEAPRSLRFSFDAASTGADPAPVCALRFEDYTRALTGAGFTGEPMASFPGSESWYFTRGDIGVTAYTQDRGGEQNGTGCLSRLIISAYA